MSKPIVIGIAGRKQSGKNYAADLIRKECEDSGLTVEVIAFADPIKDMLKAGLGLTDAHFETEEAKSKRIERYEDTPRGLMQTLGTDWGRDLIHPSLWITVAEQKIQSSSADVIVISDVRFDNEAAMIRAQENGHIAEVIRAVWHIDHTDKHKSENGINTFGSDFLIPNNFTDAFDLHVSAVLSQVMSFTAEREAARSDETYHDRV